MADKDPSAGRHEPPLGTRLGRYRLDEIVGRGGMGTVYRSFDEQTRREVAVKILLPGLPDSLVQRFLAESEAEAKIRHAHVMPVYDRGIFEKDRHYFVMELLYEPITLADVVDRVQKGTLGSEWPRLRHWSNPARLIQDVLVPVARGVDAANRDHDILHRDLKPDNVLIDVRTRRAYLIDFGICHSAGQPAEAGKIVGTPRFLSPEQARGDLDPRTDVWGLGALIYFVLSGRPPMRSSSPLRRAERDKRIEELREAESNARAGGDTTYAGELHSRCMDLLAPSFRTLDDMLDDARLGRYEGLPDTVPAAARAIVHKAMALAPADRYESAADLADDLDAWVGGGNVRALSEQHAAGAAMAVAQRTARRALGPALLSIAGLLAGLGVGAAVLSGPTESVVEQNAAVTSGVEDLATEVDGLAGHVPSPAEGQVIWRSVRTRVQELEGRANSLPEGPARRSALAKLDDIDRRTAVPVTRVSRPTTGTYVIESVFDGSRVPLDAPEIPLAPGPYLVRQEGSEHLRVPFYVPWPMRLPPPAPVEVTVPTRAGADPEGMRLVPSGPPLTGEDPIPTFWISATEIGCLDWAEWLDELPDEERDRHLPPQGFAPDPAARGHYILVPGFENRPVTGIPPASAAAYAAWRAQVFKRAFRLATPAEWRRAAGGALLDADDAMLFRPLGVSPEGKAVPDRSPYGVENALGAPAEIVLGPTGAYRLVGSGDPAGIPRTAEALRGEVEVPGEQPVAAGFRLVLPVE